MNRPIDRQLPQPLDHDSVWSFIIGASARQLYAIERQTGYELRLAAAVGWQDKENVQGVLYRRISIHSDADLAQEHDRIATTVQEIVQEHWEVETLSFQAGSVISTYQRLEWQE